MNQPVSPTNDGRLNNIRRRMLTVEMIRQAIDKASDGPIREGSVGAGTGTMAFGWKGATPLKRLLALLPGSDTDKEK